VFGIDIEIRAPNRKAIETHELAPYITLIEGDSIAAEVVGKVGSLLSSTDRVMVILDSNHSKHMLRTNSNPTPLSSLQVLT